MNQEKIGKFIATLRKEKNMTQQELATKIGVTDRAISNWETGRRLPDYSLLKNISDTLDISINDLLAGEKIKEKDLVKKTDENINNLTELINLKPMKYGIIGMCIFFMILILISTFKNVSPAPLVSMMCAYNSVTFFSKYKFDKDEANIVTGILFGLAMILNTIAFILK